MPGYTPLTAITGPIIDGKTTGNTKIFTTENGTQRFIPVSFHIETITYTANVINTPPTVSIGSNASTYNNLLSTGDLGTLLGTILSSTGLVMGKNVTDSNSVPSLAPNTDIYCRITLATSATAYSFRVDTQGYYV